MLEGCRCRQAPIIQQQKMGSAETGVARRGSTGPPRSASTRDRSNPLMIAGRGPCASRRASSRSRRSCLESLDGLSGRALLKMTALDGLWVQGRPLSSFGGFRSSFERDLASSEPTTAPLGGVLQAAVCSLHGVLHARSACGQDSVIQDEGLKMMSRCNLTRSCRRRRQATPSLTGAIAN
jgi:hypothetical protein